MRNQFLFFCLFFLTVMAHGQTAYERPIQPIQLTPDSTVLFLTDYILNPSSIKKIIAPPGLSWHRKTTELLLLKGKMPFPIGNLQLITTTDTIDVLCKTPNKIRFNPGIITLPQAVMSANIKAGFNGWVGQRNPLVPVDALPSRRWKTDPIILPEGYHQFKIESGQLEMNPVGYDSTSNGMGGYNALFKAGAPDVPSPLLRSVASTGGLVAASCNKRISMAIAYCDNQAIPCTIKDSLVTVKIPANAKMKERSHLRIFASTLDKTANDLLIPLQNGEVMRNASGINRNDLHGNIMYFAMVDRFFDGNPANNKPLNSPDVIKKADYQGGDIEGIAKKINAGFFDELNMNSLWISPVLENPQGAFGYWNKSVTTKFSGYHGYWPTSYSIIDPRFGNDASFTHMIESAHSHKTNVLLDYVAHHVHQEHPMMKQFPNAVTPLYLPDGRMNTELWDEQRLTTWFDTFMPTLNLLDSQIRELTTDSALLLLKRFPLDGFRHDATKHIPEEFWRLLTIKIKRDLVKNGRSIYQIGETYGSPELIGSYVGSGLLDAQFDFNLYDAAVSGFMPTAEQKNFDHLAKTLSESLNSYGSHHLMGNISGNQDRPRFTSLADGSLKPGEDTKLAGYERIITNKDQKGFLCMAQLMAFNMTIPGIPVIYYGDEIGMPGANDPDNRRMMQFDNLNQQQTDLRNTVKLLTRLRKENLTLQYGDFSFLTCNQGMAYERQYFGQTCVVVFSQTSGTIAINRKIPANAKTLLGHSFRSSGSQTSINLDANDFEIFTF